VLILTYSSPRKSALCITDRSYGAKDRLMLLEPREEDSNGVSGVRAGGFVATSALSSTPPGRRSAGLRQTRDFLPSV